MEVKQQQTTAVLVEPQSFVTPTLKKMLAAGVAASFAELITIPVDTAKVRLQIQGENVNVAENKAPLKYRGMTRTMFTIAREEGIQFLYKGLTAGVHRQMCFCGVRIGLYDKVRKMYGDTSEGKPKVMVKILASITTASAAVIAFQPTEVVKIRFQAAGNNIRYTGAMNAYVTIARKEGIKGLWRGYTTNIMRLSVVNCTEIVVYDYIKSFVLYKQLMEDNTPLHFLSAIGAGFVTVAVASPIDVVKTRYTNSATGSYKGPFQCAFSILKQNGPTAFYKGFVPAFTRLCSWSIVFFLSYEQIKRKFDVK